MAVNINTLIGGNITITIGGSTPSEPTAPNGKVLYKTSADGEWLQSDADITDGAFNGFNEKGSAVAVIIPSKDASGNDVTSIGSFAFEMCNNLTSVTIPDSVTDIGEGAFFDCTGLTSLTIPDSVMIIGSEAFSGCSGITSVTIPGSVTSIGRYAFVGCSGLASVTIGNSVTSIGDEAFSGCSGITSVTIPNSVTSIGDWAFDGCSGLTSVTITANGGNAENVKQMLIGAGVSESITWNMPS